jgi:eukaryotic-like serine/threonine-protein kinase
MSDHDPHGEATRVDTPVTDPTMAMPAVTGGQPPVGPPPTGEPPAEPPDRRPWIIGGLLLLILLIGLAILLLADDDDTATEDTTTTTTESTTTTSETTTTTTEATTTTASTTTTTTPPSTVDPSRCVTSEPEDPEPVAQVVYEAYTLGDRDCAGNLATADAVDQLFAIPGGGGGWTFQGCFDEDVPDPHTLCGFSFEGGSTSFRMNYNEVEGWTVYEVFQTAD